MILFSRPLVWLGLLAIWLLLNGSVAPGQIILGMIVATFACWTALPLAGPNFSSISRAATRSSERGHPSRFQSRLRAPGR